MDPHDRQEIEIHNTQELDQAAEDEVVEYLQSRPAVHPLFDDLLKQFQRGLEAQAERMRKVGKL